MAKGQWVTVQLEDKEIVYKYERHTPVPLKGTPWLYCRYCGLLYLSNAFTRWSIRMGCMNRYHPTYNRMREHFTGGK